MVHCFPQRLIWTELSTENWVVTAAAAAAAAALAAQLAAVAVLPVAAELPAALFDLQEPTFL
jgi:hypothetical protein